MQKISNIGKNSLSSVLDAVVFFMSIYQAPISKKIMLAQFGEDFSRISINSALNRLCRKGFISKLKEKNNIFLNITNKNKFYCLGDYVTLKIKKSKNRWDGKWRLVIYDIPEKRKVEREYLRSILGLLGFGKIQDSCWASPYDYSGFVYDLAKRRGIVDCICLYEGKFFAGREINSLINEAWKIEDIKDNYSKVFSHSEELLGKLTMRNIELKDVRKEYVEIYNLFRETTESDPFLPAQFLIDWPFQRVENKVKELALGIFKNSNLQNIKL